MATADTSAGSASEEPKSRTINLRVSEQTRELIDRAAGLVGKSRSEFMLESARLHATDVLLDRRLFELSEAQHDAFMHALDNPPQPSAELKKLMSSKPRWEK